MYSNMDISSALSQQINKLISLFEQLAQAARDAASAESSATSSGGGVDGLPMASGGLVHGRSGIDSNLAWLTRGEYVIREAAVRMIGLPALDMINAMQAPRFASGGLNTSPRLASITPNMSVSGQRVLNLSIEGRSFSGLSIPEHTAQSLERFAVRSQIASAGRKQSWRR